MDPVEVAEAVEAAVEVAVMEAVHPQVVAVSFKILEFVTHN